MAKHEDGINRRQLVVAGGIIGATIGSLFRKELSGLAKDGIAALKGSEVPEPTKQSPSGVRSQEYSTTPQEHPTREPYRKPTAEEAFQYALSVQLFCEGKYSNDAYDPGGPTNLGVTHTTLSDAHDLIRGQAFPADVKNLTHGQAETIYRELLWERWGRCDRLADASPGFSMLMFDACCNHGYMDAWKYLRQAIRDELGYNVAKRGFVTRDFIGAIKEHGWSAITKAFIKRRYDLYNSELKNRGIYGDGWRRRLDAFGACALAIVDPAAAAESLMEAAPIDMRDGVANRRGTLLLQAVLNETFYGGEKKLKADGMFGPITTAALRDFQSDCNIPQTGMLDNKTLMKLLERSEAESTHRRCYRP